MNTLKHSNRDNIASNRGFSQSFRRIFPFVGLFAIAISGTYSLKFFSAIVSSYGYSDFKGNVFNFFVSGLITLLLFTYFIQGVKGNKIKKIKSSMLLKGFFHPSTKDEQLMPGNLQYVGFDFDTGIVGVGSVFKRGENYRKVLYFPCEVIERYHFEGNTLILALRNRRLSVLRIQMLNAQVFERKIEQASNMVDSFVKGRSSIDYKRAYEKLLKSDTLIEADY